MGIGGSRTLKREIMDPDVFKTMLRGDNDGIYRLPDRADYVLPVPDVSTESIPGEEPAGTRNILINYMGREYALRHISNWMGERGWIRNIRWGIMSPESLAVHGKQVPVNPDAEQFFKYIPEMKGKHVMTHGLTGDLAIVKSYVYNKYVCDGEFMVELAWWIETIDGIIWEEGGATVRLPSKKANN
jgi:hypothetical protein